VNYYSHLLVLRYALNVIHTVKIRYDKRFVKKNLKIFFSQAVPSGRGKGIVLFHPTTLQSSRERHLEIPAAAP
jgi:hypothetical protein